MIFCRRTSRYPRLEQDEKEDKRSEVGDFEYAAEYTALRGVTVLLWKERLLILPKRWEAKIYTNERTRDFDLLPLSVLYLGWVPLTTASGSSKT